MVLLHILAKKQKIFPRNFFDSSQNLSSKGSKVQNHGKTAKRAAAFHHENFQNENVF
jgi:hypothetical protein